MSEQAFYEPLGGNRFRSTEHTAGPWDPSLQHGGPPAALLVRAVEREAPAWPATVARVTVDILGPVPVAEVSVRSRVLRPGRSVELVEAELEAGGRAAVRVHAWRVRRAALELPALPAAHDDAVTDPVPAFPDADAMLPPGWTGGYLHAMQWRLAAGAWGEAGPATIWGRMRVPLLPDEAPSGLQRVMTIADSAAASRMCYRSVTGCSSTPSSPCTSRPCRTASGSAWTPAAGSTRAASGSPPRGCSTGTGWLRAGRSRCSLVPDDGNVTSWYSMRSCR